MKKIYIVLPNVGVSGAEKRFFNIWYNLHKDHPIYLIINYKSINEIISQLKIDISIYDNKKIIFFESKKESLINQIIKIYMINKKIQKKSIIHFPIIYLPMFSLLRSSKFIVSWVAPYKPNNFKIIKIKYFIITMFSFLFSSKIDILNHNNYFYLSRNSLLKNKLSLTAGGSFANPEIYKPKKKISQIVFSGRLVSEKGILEFINCIIPLKKILLKNNIQLPKIIILGRGHLYENIQKNIKNTDYNDIDIEVFFSNEPYKYLSVSKIFISLQHYSNYPSQSLIEAMLCGCIPIITNSPDSEKMISNELAFFIDNKINYDQLINAIMKILKYSDNDFFEIKEMLPSVEL